jgi:hypothetical protein
MQIANVPRAVAIGHHGGAECHILDDGRHLIEVRPIVERVLLIMMPKEDADAAVAAVERQVRQFGTVMFRMADNTTRTGINVAEFVGALGECAFELMCSGEQRLVLRGIGLHQVLTSLARVGAESLIAGMQRVESLAN